MPSCHMLKSGFQVSDNHWICAQECAKFGLTDREVLGASYFSKETFDVDTAFYVSLGRLDVTDTLPSSNNT